MFSAETVPGKLTSEHRLKPGVWGQLCVGLGLVEFHTSGPSPSTTAVRAGESLIIEPALSHFVRLSTDVQFKVSFYR
ncbi:DUF1971 domain-containing protein [Qipengyuania marincola]|uniref:DUF1971 domain-containing protein n=1 Tax=Qipengyuania sp. XHP0207 TaxID=3038078 RepID=UPI0040676F4B